MVQTGLLGSLVLLSTGAFAANDLGNCVMTGVIGQPTQIMTAATDIKKAINVCKEEDKVKCLAQISDQIGQWGVVASDIAKMVAKCSNNPNTEDDFASCGTDATNFVANVGLVISSSASLSDDCDGSDSDSDVDSDDESASQMALATCGLQVVAGGNELYESIDMIVKAKDDCNSTNLNKTGGGAKCAAEILDVFNGGAGAMVSIATAIEECTGTPHPVTKCLKTITKFVEAVTGLASAASAMAKDCSSKGTGLWASNSVMSRFDMGLKHLATLSALKTFKNTEDNGSLAVTVLVVLAAFASITLIGFAARKALRNPARRVATQDQESEEGLVAEVE